MNKSYTTNSDKYFGSIKNSSKATEALSKFMERNSVSWTQANINPYASALNLHSMSWTTAWNYGKYNFNSNFKKD